MSIDGVRSFGMFVDGYLAWRMIEPEQEEEHEK